MYELNENIFFVIKNQKLILWDYQKHSQFELDYECFNTILILGKVYDFEINYDFNNKVEELIENGILIPQKNLEPSLSKNNWKFDLLSKIFHIGTSNVGTNYSKYEKESFASEYIKYCNQIVSNQNVSYNYKRTSSLHIKLPKNELDDELNISLISCFKNRKTIREFELKSFSLNTLATFLFYSFGYIHDEEFISDDIQLQGKRKSSPSGGNLHPTQVYLYLRKIEKIQDGIYHYCASDHSLALVKSDFNSQELPEILLGQYFSQNANINIFITSRFELTAWKYPHSRGYRASLLDVGHISQTAQLMATGLGLSTWITGAFMDCAVNKILEIDGVLEAPIFFMSVGYGTNKVIPNEFINF